MTLAALDAFGLSQHAAFCPPPLHIQKNPRRATFRRRVFRKSIHHRHNDQYVYGPLDDIIDEIKSHIWESPHDYSTEQSLLSWAAPLEVPPSWAVTPLPVSRLPSSQPLTIRKNRESRSSTSGFSMADPMYFSRSSSRDDALDGGPVGAAKSTGVAPWPLIDVPVLHEAVHATNNPGVASRSKHVFNTEEEAVSPLIPTKHRPSRLRIFTGFSRLRRTDTGETSGSSGDAPGLASPTSLAAPNENELDEETLQEPSDDAVEAYVRKNARNGAKLGSLLGRIARRLPSPNQYREDDLTTHTMTMCEAGPSTLRTAVKVFSEISQLSQEEHQEFWVAVDVEGTLHNRVLLPDSTIDVIFVVDNAYYVSRECLNRALDAVNSALYYLDRGDRMALYATHCTHQAVSGNRPDSLFPIGPFNADTEEAFRNLAATTARHGTQSWQPPRPNPSMADVILGIARSIEDKDLKYRRTHVILLSPAAHILHDVSKSCPDLYIHQVNPAAIPYRRLPTVDDTQCVEECCKNVFISNCNHFQSLPGRIKRILKHARSVKPVGEITQVCIDVRAREGCEVIECLGTKDIASLHLGQVHTIFAKVRVTRTATKAIDLFSRNPVLNSSLDVKDLRQQLQNAVTVGAFKAHLFDVQVYYQNTLNATDCWSYTETPYLIVRDLGGLAPPFDTAVEVHKRLLLHRFAQLDTDARKSEAEIIISTLTNHQEPLRKLVQRILREADCYQQVLEYEREHRQKLPLCPGPIDIEASPHEWLGDVWNRKKIKRQGVAVVEGEEISGLIDGLHGLERLG